MTRLSAILIGGMLLTVAILPTSVAQQIPKKFVAIDQNIDQATLQRYHHTDQGTRLAPAAWLAALEQADGSGQLMGTDNLRRVGFIVDNVVVDAMNPYGWPVGFTVSDPKKSGGISVAGLTCAACHTGQIEYKGTAVQIEGGQAMIDSVAFFNGLNSALAATAKDPSRRAKFFADATKAGYPAERMEADFLAAVAGLAAPQSAPPSANTPEGHGRSDAVGGIANRVFGAELMVPANLKTRDAPVSYPYLWDIWRLSWVQYNGFLPGANAQSRNIGEALGTFGKANFVAHQTGALNPEPSRWQTSLQLDNLLWLEKTLRRLRAPTWPANILGPIDPEKAKRGRELFTAHCAGCHGIKELPNGNWDVTVVLLERIGTDPNMTRNWAANTYDGSRLGLGDKVFAADGLPVVINAIRKQLYAENNTPASEREPDIAMEAPCGYKARPLIGVWATPPFLHNGSVRTVFDLLSEARPATFTVGSREYDPVNLGYVDGPGLDPFVFDTSVAGNSNAGHWFTDDRSRAGRIGRQLADAEKDAIIEFLKSATYDNYPSEKHAQEAAMPCQGTKDWALKN